MSMGICYIYVIYYSEREREREHIPNVEEQSLRRHKIIPDLVPLYLCFLIALILKTKQNMAH